MTVKEAIKFLKHPSQWESLNVGKQIAIDTLIDAQPCEDTWIIDALKEFLGERYSVITCNKKEFVSWLERLKWHVGKCNELDKELREYQKTTKELTENMKKTMQALNGKNEVGA